MQVIPAEIKDAQEINHIKTEAYRDEKKRFGPWQSRKQGGPDWYHDEWYNNIDETKHLIESYYYFKIIRNDEIIGCFWLHDIDDNTIELEDFCIAPEHQNNGYGSETLKIMEEIFPLKRKWILSTPFYSVRNQHLYEKSGYKKIGENVNNMIFLYEKKIR